MYKVEQLRPGEVPCNVPSSTTATSSNEMSVSFFNIYHIIQHFIHNIHLCFMRLLSRVLSQRVWPSSLCGRSTPRLHKPPEPNTANCFTKSRSLEASKDEKLHPRNSRPLTQVLVTALEPRASLEVSASPRCAKSHKMFTMQRHEAQRFKDPDSRAKNCVSREAMAIAYEQIHGTYVGYLCKFSQSQSSAMLTFALRIQISKRDQKGLLNVETSR